MAINLDKHIGFNHYIRKAFGKWLDQEDITEICINRPNEVFYERNQEWFYEKIDFSYESCEHLVSAIASFKKDRVNTVKPILSATLLNGERVQVVIPPACEVGTISITVRKPNIKRFTRSFYVSSGIYSEMKRFGQAIDQDDDLIHLYKENLWDDFIALAVKKKKNIIVAGATGTGKTTYMKMLVDLIPNEERIITIEDTHELDLVTQKNYVHLLYPSEAKEGDIVTASSLLKCCMRMKPDRILLAELRGGETFDFLKVLKSGHSGSITSIHASSVAETFRQMCNYVTAHPQGLAIPYNIILSELKNNIDIVLSMVVRNKKRLIREIYFKNEDRDLSENFS
ncbi:MAG: P-type DNA transfer ATPase VirB11 [Neisseriaceae bacterium]|nr:MAG: P-type DNA transfer ATPase VirB11 [Neisseriaceae bacterium]